MPTSDTCRELGEASWAWTLRHVRDDDGPWLPEEVTDGWQERGPGEYRDGLYGGVAGVAFVLAEIAQHRGLTDAEQGLAAGIVERLARTAATEPEPSLYDGLAGHLAALRLLAPGAEQLAEQRLADLATPTGWRTTLTIGPDGDTPLTDIIMGSAGIMLAAIWAGGEHAEAIATTGGEALLQVADETDGGLDWGMWPGATSKGPNFSHGTAGIAATLAVAGASYRRTDFVDAAVRGAEHLLTVGSLDDGGFIVPHTIPPTTSREVEPLTFTWCHGPAGTSQLFAALAHAGVDEVAGHRVTALRERCMRSTLTSGIPHRLRPGFWDNDGRCCGTAGVGEVLLDAAQDCPDPVRAAALLDAASVMGDALVERAVRDQDGARWRFVEYRIEEPLLPPSPTWMQGAAGIAAFLLRLARVLEDPAGAPVVDRPDQWWAVPARLRTVHADAG